MPLTDKMVRAMTAGPTTRRRWDGDGLFFEILPAGHRRWMFKFVLNGRERRMSLGPYPAVSLKEARIARDEVRRQLRAGLDPIAERQRVKRERSAEGELTVKAACEAWLAWAELNGGKRGPWTPAYKDDVVGAFTRYVYGPIGRMALADVTPALMLRLVFEPVAGLGKFETARRLRQRLEDVWNHARIAGRAPQENPAAVLAKYIGRAPVTNFASAKEQELAGLLVAVRGYGNRLIEHAVLLQLLTATRPGETRAAQWDEFDLGAAVWSIPAARTKRRRDHLVPLSTQALDVLMSLQQLTGGSPLCFPSRSRWDVPMSVGAVIVALHRLGFKHVTAHGFRSLFSTTCHEHGHPSHVIEASLAHLDTGVKGTYNKALYLPQRRDLLQWWGDRIEALCRAHAEKTGTRPIFPLVEASPQTTENAQA